MNQKGNAYGTGPGDGIWPETKMSINRYTMRFVHSGGHDTEEDVVKLADHLAAVQAERERLVKECVEPLMNRLKELLDDYDAELDDADSPVNRSYYHNRIVDLTELLAAVKAKLAGKEKT